LIWGSDDGVSNVTTLVVTTSATQIGTYGSVGQSAFSGDTENGSITSDAFTVPTGDSFLILGSTDADEGLPVNLTSFSATGTYGQIDLYWKTESEINNLGFAVERKNENEDEFTVISSYISDESLAGNGTISHETEYYYSDKTVEPKIEYTYRLVQYDYGGAVNIEKILTSAVALEPLPTKFEVAQNYPNPFNPETTIKVGVPEKSRIKVTLFNMLGQEVLQLANDEFEAGHYRFRWDGKNQQGVQTSSGLYFYVVQVNFSKGAGIIKSRKMVKLQ